MQMMMDCSWMNERNAILPCWQLCFSNEQRPTIKSTMPCAMPECFLSFSLYLLLPPPPPPLLHHTTRKTEKRNKNKSKELLKSFCNERHLWMCILDWTSLTSVTVEFASFLFLFLSSPLPPPLCRISKCTQVNSLLFFLIFFSFPNFLKCEWNSSDITTQRQSAHTHTHSYWHSHSLTHTKKYRSNITFLTFLIALQSGNRFQETFSNRADFVGKENCEKN